MPRRCVVPEPGVGEVSDATFNKLFEIIAERLPYDARILLLSHTGSRAYGWSWYNFDYDIHGVFACKNWWDWVHLGVDMFDINLYELRHLTNMDLYYKHGEVIINLGNPVYLDPEFPWDDVLDLVTPDFFPDSGVDYQLAQLRVHFSCRTALHAYRVMIVPMHFMRFGVFEHNIFRAMCNLGLGYEGPYRCRENYLVQHRVLPGTGYVDESVERLVWRELGELRRMFSEYKERYRKQWSRDKWERLVERLRVFETDCEY